ncbi:hypothetical protein CCO04_07855 [Pimelobacter sp. 30-1]|nr:hypothetical protein [Pimelobacter sp. 30-1]
MDNAVDIWSRELHPLIAEIRREPIGDLPRPEEHAPETKDLASPLLRSIKASHELTVDVQVALQGDVDSFLTMIFDLADAFGSQLTNGILAHISDICDASGQTISTEGRDIFDVMIETLETIDISFDENGEHNLTIVMNPDTAQKLQSKIPTPEQEAQVKEVLERRRKEWNASRRRHELP